MDTILDALSCSEWSNILSSPVCLPCGHFICKFHTDTKDERIKCWKCGSTHKNRNFVVVQALENMIKAKLANFNFGPHHAETRIEP